jgi:hypothetical protein
MTITHPMVDPKMDRIDSHHINTKIEGHLSITIWWPPNIPFQVDLERMIW